MHFPLSSGRNSPDLRSLQSVRTNANCEGVHILTPLVRGSPLKAGTSSVDSEVYLSSSSPAGNQEVYLPHLFWAVGPPLQCLQRRWQRPSFSAVVASLGELLQLVPVHLTVLRPRGCRPQHHVPLQACRALSGPSCGEAHLSLPVCRGRKKLTSPSGLAALHHALVRASSLGEKLALGLLHAAPLVLAQGEAHL